MRKDPHGNPLPPRIYYKSGRYYYVRENRWHTLSRDYTQSLIQRARLESPSGDWPALVRLVYERYHKRHLDGDLATATLKQYDGVRARIEYAFSEFSPEQITTADITAFLDEYEDTPNIANRMLTVIKAICDRAVRRGQAPFNPAASIKRFPEKKRDRYITDAEFLAIHKAASPTIRLVMDLCYLTAQRISDVLSVRLDDISGDGITFRQQKSGSRLLVQTSPEIERVIRDAKALHKVSALYLFHPKGRGTRYSYAAIRDAFKRARDKAGVADVTIHDIRAKAITDAEAIGLDPQALAGHSSRAMTERYLRLKKTAIVRGPAKLGGNW